MRIIMRTPLQVYETKQLCSDEVDTIKDVIKSAGTWLSITTTVGQVILMKEVLSNTIFEFKE